jgi:hypothetical protein
MFDVLLLNVPLIDMTLLSWLHLNLLLFDRELLWLIFGASQAERRFIVCVNLTDFTF